MGTTRPWPPDVLDRLDARSLWAGDCLVWQGAKNGGGYGHFGYLGRTIPAHRIACEMEHGPAPDDKPWALHRCGRRDCIRPDHLYWGTASHNQADAVRHGTHYSARRTRCVRGHLFDALYADGRRRCLTCEREACRRYYARKKALAA